MTLIVIHFSSGFCPDTVTGYGVMSNGSAGVIKKFPASLFSWKG
jgi:hypothetical protein